MGRKAVWWVTETLLLWISIGCACAAIGTWVALNIDPFHWAMGNLLSLLSIPILVLNVCFVLWWLMRRYWSLTLIPLMGIAFQFSTIESNFNWNSKTIATVNEVNRNTIASYNIHEFKGKAQIAGSAALPLSQLIEENEIDIICFQEFKQALHFSADTISALLKMPFFALATDYNRHFFDVAIFSKYPIIDQGIIQLNSTTRVAQWARIQFPKGDVVVVNCHLESTEIHTSQRFIGRIVQNGQFHQINEAVVRQVDGLIESSKVRTDQTRTIIDFCQKSKFPILLCGDFNFPPNCYAYNQIVQKLADSFVYSQNFTEPTFISLGQLLRIDYIFFNSQIVPQLHRTIETDLSDHFPVIFHFDIK